MFAFFVAFWSAYTLTDRDYEALDIVEDRLFDIMEEKNLDADTVIDAIYDWMSNKKLNEKANQLLAQLIDDIDYYWYGDDEWNIERYMTEEDCYDDEYFDADEERCFPNEEEDLDIDHDHWDGDEEDADMPILWAYLVQEDDSLMLVDGDEDARHQEVWKLFSSIIPQAARPDLTEVNFADDATSDTAGYVTQSNAHHEKRTLAFNLSSYYIDGKLDYDESVHTNIHEFAHILTFQKSQVQLIDPMSFEESIQRYEEDCLTYFVWEGCLRRTAYIKLFIDAFWDEEELERAREDEEPDDYTPQEYVSDYAATNPWEDIAESFTHFVLHNKPTGDSEAEQKVAFFYDYPELVKLRSFMRSRIK